MIEGRIKTVDVANRTAVITTEDDKEMVITFPEDADIEVAELETMGTEGGELTDLQEGYYVEVEVGAQDSDGRWSCDSLVCVS
ncbi:MAG: hypothetical protein ACE5JU_21775 [Candidatus Binatia bacterium]